MYNIADKDWKDIVKRENKIPAGSIIGVRWAKPIKKCSQNQCITHVVLILTAPSATNSLLRDSCRKL